MAKKKSVPAKKSRRKTNKKAVKTSKKFSVVLKNLILFAVLSIISFTLYKVSEKEIYMNLFYIIFMLSVLVALAFLIAHILLFLKVLKK